MKQKIIEKLNRHYHNHLAKEKNRRRLNDFLYFFVWKIVFKLFSLKGVNKKLILFVANADYSMPNDFELLYNHFKNKGYNCLCLYKFKGGSPCIYKNELSKIKSDIVFQKYFAQAKVTFLNEYYLPAYANKPRKGSRLVQLWHGCGAFKKFSYSVRDVDWGLQSELFDRYHVHKNYTDIITSAPYITDKWTEAFNAEEGVIKPLGTPRTDIFYNNDYVSESKAKLEEKFPQIKGRKILLWAPTLRGKDVQSSYTDKAIDFVKLKKELGNDYALLLKLHPRIAGKLPFSDEEQKELEDFLFDISKDTSINVALCASDVCITDYSSLIFEYSLLERPMIFYAYDLNDYKDGRNFYYDYESFVPGEIAKTTDELISAIRNADSSFNKQIIKSFRDRFMESCDGNCCEKVFNEVTK